MLSVLLCSRTADNPDSALPRLLETAEAHVAPRERGLIEFLIKFDDDDRARPHDHAFEKYPFAVRPFTWSRGEGRHSLHHAQEYLFAQRDPRSRFCLLTADDFVFTRTGFVSEICQIRDELCILAPNRPDIEKYAGIYEQEDAIRRWVVAFGDWSPVVSSRLIEVCQNLGWQANVDSWLMGLSVVLFDLYKVCLWRTMAPFYARRGGHGLGDTPTYNNMELTGLSGPANKYWFELLRRQARNVYLNLAYGTDLDRVALSHTPWRLWHKFRSQPLRRLPVRLYHRARRSLSSLLS